MAFGLNTNVEAVGFAVPTTACEGFATVSVTFTATGFTHGAKNEQFFLLLSLQDPPRYDLWPEVSL